MTKEYYENYLKILRSELLPAMGCTEPIAVAYAAAKSREVLGCMPDRMVARCSGNIIKNVKSVVVPNSGGERGIEAAAVLGVVGGQSDLGLQVISRVTPEQMTEAKRLRSSGICACELANGEGKLYIHIQVWSGAETVTVEIRDKHDHIAKITKNGTVIFSQDDLQTEISGDKSLMSLEDILAFANLVEVEDIQELIGMQITYNAAISEEGLKTIWGAAVGQTILEAEGDDLIHRAKAAAAAGSDARMNGCALPVVINSGSGNQGITCSIPVMVYAKELKVSHEKLLRALVLSNLISIHQKRYIGNLSAYCGAVSAGTAAACGIAYLNDADYDLIGRTIINTLGNVGGIICDGAKSSCASKISSAVEAGILGYEMARRGRMYQFGEGIVEGDYEQTIRNIGCVGKDGMRETDVTILNLMINTKQ